MILANDDRPHTMHAEAERTDRDLLPEVVAALPTATIRGAACARSGGMRTARPREPAPQPTNASPPPAATPPSRPHRLLKASIRNKT